MSRLTGNDAYGLMEAYSAVYQPRLELTEEQVWEEVEDWVNALIEEGYDLSDYTWEEMYEAYINEISAMHLQLATQPKPPAEVRKAPAKKPSPADFATAAGTAAAGGAALTTMARDVKRKSKPRVSPVFKEAVDVYDIILSHLLDEGYANSVDAAEAIMVNMSEDWRDIIIEEILDEANGRAQIRKAARDEITHQKKIGTMTSNVDPEHRIGPKGYLAHRGKTEPKPTSELKNPHPAGRRRSEARRMINTHQTNLRTMTSNVNPEHRIGPEGYLAHRGETRG